jgi:tetratricopeptide (TPR) repeat protein
MLLSRTNLLISGLICAVALVLTNCKGRRSEPVSATDSASPAAASPSTEDTSASIIRELEERVRRDPEDFIAFNKLAGYYLQRLRESGDVKYLELARRAADASAAILPAEQNAGALSTLTQVDFASHNFASTQEKALLLMRIEPRKSQPYQIMTDALMEIGDYKGAEEALQKLQQLGGVSISSETRLARFDLLHGHSQLAQQRLTNALALALDQVPLQNETIAWCRWQLGEAAFSTGKYEQAERYYREALETLPNYYRALGSMARTRAALNDVPGAIDYGERAVRVLPDPTFVALLGDLYKISGREREANGQYSLVEHIAHLNALNGALYNRQLALFYADHDLKPEEAFTLASNEYKLRRDVYGADAVAWTALKAGKIKEATAAIQEALRLGTNDAKLFYHAGLIAHASGDKNRASNHLKRALALNPGFDPLQARIAHQAITE